MRERFEHLFLKPHNRPSLSQQLHQKLALPGHYTPPRPLRDLYVESGRALLDDTRASAEETIDCFKKALQADTTHSRIKDWEIMVYLAAAYEKKGDTQIAFHTYLEAVLLEPQHVIPLLERTHELLTTKIVRLELAWIEREWITVRDTLGLTGTQRAKITQFLGRVYLHADKYPDAIRCFEVALIEIPDDVRVLEGLGQAKLNNGETKFAIDILRKAYSLTTKGKNTERSSDTRRKLVQALADDGQYKEALSFVPDDILASIAPDKKNRFYVAYRFALMKGLCHLSLGEPQKALEAANLATGFRSTSCKSHLLEAQAYIALKNYDKALEATNEALLHDPGNNDTLFYEAQARIEGYKGPEQGLKLLQSYRELINDREAIADQSILERIQSAPFTVREGDASMHYFRAQLYFTFSQDEESEHEYYAEAEQEIKHVFELSFVGENSKLEAPAQQLRGDLIVGPAKKKGLRLSEEQEERAAKYFYEAGVLFYNQATGDSKEAAYDTASEKVLAQAIDLRPDHALSYIYRAAALLYSFFQSQTFNNGHEQFEEIRRVWKEGEKRGIPQSFASWAYFIYANGLYQQATMIGVLSEKSKALYWEATYYLERTVILTPDDELYYLLLGYCYFFLDRPVSALKTIQMIRNRRDLLPLKVYLSAVLLEDENAVADIVAGPENSVYVSTHAWLLYLDKQFQAVIKRLEACIAADEKYISARTLCGRAYRMLGEDRQARAHFQYVWDVTAPGQPLATPDNMQERANVAYELHDYAEAIHILENMSEESPSNPLDRYAIRAFCYLALKDTGKAREALQQARKYFPSMTLVLHSSLQDLEELESFHLHEYGQDPEVQAIITPYKDALQRAYLEVQAQARSGNATEEIKQSIQQHANKERSFLWLASLAAAARFSLQDQRIEDAIIYYQELLDDDATKETAMFPEARLGKASACVTLGVQCAFDEQVAVAKQHLHEGLQLYIKSKQNNPVQLIAQYASTRIETPQQYRAMNETLHLLAHTPTLDAQQRRDLLLAQMQLSRDKYFTTQHPDQDYIETKRLAREFVAEDSIALELGLDLVDEKFVTEQIVKIAIPAMREHIRESTGVTIAGVHMRDNPALPDNAYQILLYNVPDAIHTLPVDHSTKAARDASISNAYTAILSHLEVHLHANLDMFLGTQEVQLMLDMWKQANVEERCVLIKESLSDDNAVARLAQVLRRLVRTQTSIEDLKSILTTFKDTQTLEMDAIVEQIRSVLQAEKNKTVSG